MPCCGDALSAKLIHKAGFPLSFLSGYFVAATLGFPDVGVVSRSDMVTRAKEIMSVVPFGWPIIGDGDTGGAGVYNISQTCRDYASVGLAGIMIEDQVDPKKCGHTRGKSVVDRQQARERIQAALNARETGMDIFILARTDAAGPLGLDEAIDRCKMFMEMGVDMTFLEAPLSEADMIRYCSEVPGLKLANMIEKGGKTPVMTPKRLGEIGYVLSAHPVSLLSASIKAMKSVLGDLKRVQEVGEGLDDLQDKLESFPELCQSVGFDDFWQHQK